MTSSPEPDFFGWDLKDFVRSFFGSPTYEDPGEGQPDWAAWHEAIQGLLTPGEDYDPERLLQHAAAFCRDPQPWMEPYSGKAFSKGAFMLFNEHSCLGPALYEHPTAWESKAAFIQSIPNLYSGLAHWQDEDAHMGLFMLWDGLCYGFKFGRYDLKDPEILRVQSELFGALSRMLEFPEPLPQDAALHGLNHLVHPEGPDLIASWVRRHPELDKDRRAYAQSCAMGQAL